MAEDNGPIDDEADGSASVNTPTMIDGEPAPAWFGALRGVAARTDDHDLESIRRSVAREIVAERLAQTRNR